MVQYLNADVIDEYTGTRFRLIVDDETSDRLIRQAMLVEIQTTSVDGQLEVLRRHENSNFEFFVRFEEKFGGRLLLAAVFAVRFGVEHDLALIEARIEVERVILLRLVEHEVDVEAIGTWARFAFDLDARHRSEDDIVLEGKSEACHDVAQRRVTLAKTEEVCSPITSRAGGQVIRRLIKLLARVKNSVF